PAAKDGDVITVRPVADHGTGIAVEHGCLPGGLLLQGLDEGIISHEPASLCLVSAGAVVPAGPYGGGISPAGAAAAATPRPRSGRMAFGCTASPAPSRAGPASRSTSSTCHGPPRSARSRLRPAIPPPTISTLSVPTIPSSRAETCVGHHRRN